MAAVQATLLITKLKGLARNMDIYEVAGSAGYRNQ